MFWKEPLGGGTFAGHTSKRGVHLSGHGIVALDCLLLITVSDSKVTARKQLPIVVRDVRVHGIRALQGVRKVLPSLGHSATVAFGQLSPTSDSA